MNKVISIDPSLRSTGVYAGGKLYTLNNKTNKEVSAIEALKNIYEWFIYFGTKYNPKIALVEDYSYSRSESSSMTDIAEIRGILHVVSFECGFVVIPVNITLWKSIVRFSMQKGTKPKNDNYIVAARQRYPGFDFKSTDEVDAFMIYQAVATIYQYGPNTEAQTRLINEVKKWL